MQKKNYIINVARTNTCQKKTFRFYTFHFFHKNNAIIYVICRIGNPHIHCIEIYLKKKKLKQK